MTQIILYKYSNVYNLIDKASQFPSSEGVAEGFSHITILGTIRDITEVINPIITIELNTVDSTGAFPYNYAYIEFFKRRFYFIEKVEAHPTNEHTFTLYLHVDVLMSYKDFIGNLHLPLKRVGNPNNEDKYLIDGDLNALNKQSVVTRSSTAINPFMIYKEAGYRNLVLTLIGTNDKTSSDVPMTDIPTFYNTYALTDGELRSVKERLTDPTFIEALSDLFIDKNNYIVSLMEFPFNLGVIGSGDEDILENNVSPVIVDNNKSLGATAYRCKKSLYHVHYKINFGNLNVATNTFRDYSPYTEIQLYLPFYTFVNINPQDVMPNKELHIHYFTSIIDGNTTIVLTTDTSNMPDSTGIIGVYSCKIGNQLPIGATNLSEIMRNAGISAINIGMGIAGGVAGGVAGGLIATTAIGNGIKGALTGSQMKTTVGNFANTVTGIYTCLHPFVRIYSTQLIYPSGEDDYATLIGHPTSRTSLLVDTDGIIKCDDISSLPLTARPYDYDGKYPLKEEIEEIYAYLKNGVYYRLPQNHV